MRLRAKLIKVTAVFVLGALVTLMLIAAEPTASISATALNVESIERSERFYGAVLGLERVFQYPAEGDDVIEIGMVRSDQPSLMLILAHFNDDPLPEGKKTYGRIVINTDNADFIAAKAAERGATIRKLPSGGRATIIFFDDPDGYEIELYQAATPSD